MRMPRRSICGLMTAGLALVAAIVGFSFLAPPALGGSTTYVTTNGISMQPRFHTGDLAVVRPAGEYRVGDAVAYRSRQLDTVVLHRIVAVERGRFTLKGDNNSWLDPERPTGRKIIGKLALHIPRGGIWLDRATSPAALAVVAFLLVAGGGVASRTRLRSRGRARRSATDGRRLAAPRSNLLTPRSTTVSAHAYRRRRTPSFNALPPYLSATLYMAVIAGLLGLVLGVFAWSAPTTEMVAEEIASDRRVTFSYTAEVPRTPAYDSTTVTSPAPVFRKLADIVVVDFAYRGAPGTVSVSAELASSSGWRTTLPLEAETTLDGTAYDGRVSLELDALEQRVSQAAIATGVPMDQVTVTVRPRFVDADGSVFAPELQLTLTDLQLAVSPDAALTVRDESTIQQLTQSERELSLAGRHLAAADARVLSGVLVLGAVLVLLLIRPLARWTAPGSEGARIRQRYAGILVKVEPMAIPAHRPVVDVTDFATLAKVAERYGLLVLHWVRTDVETFVVQDEGATYRYRTGAGLPLGAGSEASFASG